MSIKTYWNVLYNNIFKNIKELIIQNTRNAPRHESDNLKLCDAENKFNKGYSCVFLYTRRKGSITVETSLCVPLFFMVVFSLFYIIEALFRINYIEDSLTDCAREYAVYGTKTGAVSALIDDKVLIKYDDDKSTHICYVSYNIKVPFLGSRFLKLNLYQQVVLSDYSGKSMEEETTDADEDYVYVSKSGKVYHCDRGCTYLKPSVKEISGKSVSQKRNSSGGKYKDCEKCCRNINAEDMPIVYITSYGDRYHKIRNCPGIKRDVRRVKKSEIGSLPACSKCGDNAK